MIIKAIKLTIILFLTFIIIPKEAKAYLDPGSGSYLIQVLVAAVAGGGILLKTQWHKIKNIFNKDKGQEKKDDKK
ncbi:hypothetical protein A2V49_02625 [candidate division WWE3 bacterium RBG_19FT_COMBO_34_6]|uniref:Uncharacterized protein n=1 Tax=candidate division WWE3 bacterium RBG_19FT_COMBO_34_6 TaxID=1802612 RepID=A0A1F4ULP2_UNCKA|nr:MAG: hypothetical protein A2V49_02625 [candidate division WWE3 bacterium RBG_19FT_COMBO_34_6]